ncbi:MAG: EamA family transporter [Anaerolineae bacterium]|nr:EamA family transporter [Anaerolineae bacterium]
MTGLAFGLVLVSAGLHAYWNFLAKRVSGDTSFVWLFSALATVIYFPLALYMLFSQQIQLGWAEVGAIGGTCVLHIAYYMLLNRAYRVGDLSLIYPLSRGAGPMLSVVGAVLLLGERPSPIDVAGMLLIVAGVFVITGNPFNGSQSHALTAVVYGLLVACSIAAYTLWDKQVVSVFLIPPLILTWASGAVRTVVMLPYAIQHWDGVRNNWREHRREAIGIGILDSLSYILFLIALSFSQVTQLAPLRQLSILIGAFLGAKLLSETAGRKRILAAVVMSVGVIALALG